MNKVIGKKISELVDVFNNIRVPLSSKQRESLAKIYPYYGAQGIVDYVDKYLFDGEYILIAEDGENLKSNNQNICNIVEGKFWVNNHAHIVRANAKNSTKYLYYNFNRIKFEPYVTGSSQPKLNKENLLNINVFVHDNISTQQSIAKVLSDLDTKIELNNRINAELEAMAKTLYDYWFVQFDFPYSPPTEGCPQDGVGIGKPYKSSGGKMVYNAELKREIPVGWEVGNLLMLSNLEGGGTPSKANDEYWNGNIPFYTPTDYTNSIFTTTTQAFITQNGLDSCSSKLFSKGTIFITARGTVGNITIASTETAMNQSCYAFCPKPSIDYGFLYFSVKSLISILKAKSGGSVFNSIVSNDIKQAQLAIPPTTLIQKYADISRPIFEKIYTNTKQSQYLASLRDWLLPMLMNGQVTVCEAHSSMENEAGKEDLKKVEAMCVAAEPVEKYTPKGNEH